MSFSGDTIVTLSHVISAKSQFGYFEMCLIWKTRTFAEFFGIPEPIGSCDLGLFGILGVFDTCDLRLFSWDIGSHLALRVHAIISAMCVFVSVKCIHNFSTCSTCLDASAVPCLALVESV